MAERQIQSSGSLLDVVSNLKDAAQEKLYAVMTVIVPEIVKEMTSDENISEDEAIKALYMSELYANLEKEETKLWRLSPKELYELYKQEKQTGNFDFQKGRRQ